MIQPPANSFTAPTQISNRDKQALPHNRGTKGLILHQCEPLAGFPVASLLGWAAAAAVCVCTIFKNTIIHKFRAKTFQVTFKNITYKMTPQLFRLLN